MLSIRALHGYAAGVTTTAINEFDANEVESCDTQHHVQGLVQAENKGNDEYDSCC